MFQLNYLLCRRGLTSLHKLLILGLLVSLGLVDLTGRSLENFDAGWRFHKQGSKENSQYVDIPHTWNVHDAFDDEDGYWRGVGIYEKKLQLSDTDLEKRIYLQFDGANQIAKVFVNDKLAGEHIGGYTRFVIPLSQYVQRGENEIRVEVDNSDREDLFPLSADFTFYGGIYRNIHLLRVDPVHFDLSNYGSSGIFVKTPQVSKEKAEVHISGGIQNESDTSRQISIHTTVLDNQGEIVSVQVSELDLSAESVTEFDEEFVVISPELWSPDRPNRYRIASEIYDENGNLLDALSQPLGFRWFAFKENGFYLNGEPLKLIGTNRHQDFPGLGNALPDAQHFADVEKIKAMGSNFLRISHYPQDPLVLEACDRLGLIATVEIPIVNRISENSEAFLKHAIFSQREMVRQNFNHPSVVAWMYMNEAVLRPKYEGEKQIEYLKKVGLFAGKIDAILKEEDSTRPTILVCHGHFDRYVVSEMTKYADILAWNLYNGWYGGEPEDLEGTFEYVRELFPGKPHLIAEYGAGADPRLHGFDTASFDFTEEYALDYHKTYLRIIKKMDTITAAAIWNSADFGSETRADSDPNINSKGLLSYDRKPKSSYYFYQANLLNNPFTAIGAKTWSKRTAVEDTPGTLTVQQPVSVFSNGAEVELFHNGRSLGIKATNDICVAQFDVEFVDGLNHLEAVAGAGMGNSSDLAEIDFEVVGKGLWNKHTDYQELSISLGDNRYYSNSRLRLQFLPDRPYESGYFGYVDGIEFNDGAKGKRLGTNLEIKGTSHDPVYQTARVGLSEYRLDASPGVYELTLRFAELIPAEAHEKLAYELAGDENEKGRIVDRVFDVSVNGIPVATDLNLSERAGSLKAVDVKVPLCVTDDEGIVIRFGARDGESILNALTLRRL